MEISQDTGSTALAEYDAMCSAITACHSLFDVNTIRNKASALVDLFRMSQNVEAENRAREIRFRATRRVGELLKTLPRVQPAEARRSPDTMSGDSPYRAAINAARIPERAAQRAQALANVPAQVFEDALRTASRSLTEARIISAARPRTATVSTAPRGPNPASWICGVARSFELFGIGNKSPASVTSMMTPAQKSEMHRAAPAMIEFLGQLSELLNDESKTDADRYREASGR